MKVDTLWVILSQRNPLVVHAHRDENRKAVLVFTSDKIAERYQKKRGGDTVLAEWNISDLLRWLSHTKQVLEARGVKWVIVNHPAETHPKVAHLSLQEVMGLPKNTRRISLSSTVYSPTQK